MILPAVVLGACKFWWIAGSLTVLRDAGRWRHIQKHPEALRSALLMGPGLVQTSWSQDPAMSYYELIGSWPTMQCIEVCAVCLHLKAPEPSGGPQKRTMQPLLWHTCRAHLENLAVRSVVANLLDPIMSITTTRKPLLLPRICFPEWLMNQILYDLIYQKQRNCGRK